MQFNLTEIRTTDTFDAKHASVLIMQLSIITRTNFV